MKNNDSRLHVRLMAAMLAIIFLASCTVDKGDDESHTSSHVLLVYMGADNNLQIVAHRKLNAIRDGWSGSENHKIVVYFDYKGAPAELKEIRFDCNGKKTAETVAEYNRENSASGATLARVISDVREAYPADHYGLLVFSHASGWLPEGALGNPYIQTSAASRSVVADDSYGEMELVDFAAAIPDGAFDYIVFETCFMSGVEVAYELRDKTPLILASSAEIVDPGFTPAYAASICKLLTGNVGGFGQSVFDNILAYSENAVQRSSTLSVISASGLERLAEFIGGNCDLNREAAIDDIQRFDRNGHRLFFDFGDYYGRLLDTEAQREELSRLIGDCVLWKAATKQFMTQSALYNGFAIDRHSGLTTYVPQPQFPGLNAKYETLNWTKKIKSYKQ